MQVNQFTDQSNEKTPLKKVWSSPEVTLIATKHNIEYAKSYITSESGLSSGPS